MNIKFEQFKFGFADADTELKREPELFDTTFYDAKNVVKELIFGYKFLVIGRKGTGKTAYGAKIRRLSDTNEKLKCGRLPLAEFEFRTFAKLTKSEITGGLRYYSAWKFLLLLKIYQTIVDIKELDNNERFINTYQNLKLYGLLPDDNITRVVKIASKNGFKISFPVKIGGFSVDGDQKDIELSEPEEISSTLLDVLKELYLGDYTVRIIVDGLDDILRGKDYQIDIVSGLIRAVDSMNNSFLDLDIPIKLIVLIRNDVLALCCDPDLNKIVRDSGIITEWKYNPQAPFDSDLMSLVSLRFNNCLQETTPIEKLWYELFPRAMKNKPSANFIIEHTLNRPRDILQFLLECQRLYPDHAQLNYSEVNSAIQSYSENYFGQEIKNELVGFLDDKVIRLLTSILSSIGAREFSYNTWLKVFAQYKELENENPKYIINTLFESGYIGQIRQRNNKNFYVFKYREPNERMNLEDNFVIHKGLWKVLNLI